MGNISPVMAIIAGYAAIISTITLIWNIVVFVKQNRSKVKIAAYTTASIQAIPGIGAVGSTVWNLSVELVNLSGSKKYVNRPQIKFPTKVEGYDTFQWFSPTDRAQYPICLESGEIHKVHMQLEGNFLEILDKHALSGKKLRILVTDTTGKKYLSNKVDINHLRQLCRK